MVYASQLGVPTRRPNLASQLTRPNLASQPTRPNLSVILWCIYGVSTRPNYASQLGVPTRGVYASRMRYLLRCMMASQLDMSTRPNLGVPTWGYIFYASQPTRPNLRYNLWSYKIFCSNIFFFVKVVWSMVFGCTTVFWVLWRRNES